MRVMGAATPTEHLATRMTELEELHKRVEGEIRRIKAALRRTNPNGRPPGPRPPCDTEKGYQRHYREGEHCDRCLAAHRHHERARYAARKLAAPVDESASLVGESGAVGVRANGPIRDTIGVQLKTAPGTRSVNCEPDSQGLANRCKGAID